MALSTDCTRTHIPEIPCDCGANSRLTDHDRRIIARGLSLAEVPPDGDVDAALAALGHAKDLLAEMVKIAERLGGGNG